MSQHTDLSLDLTVRERYTLMQFLPSSASRALVMGVFADIEEVLRLSDDEVSEWGFERSESGVTHEDPDYDDEVNRVQCTLPRALWNRIRAGANSMPDFPRGTGLASRCFVLLDEMLDADAVSKNSGKGERPTRTKTPSKGQSITTNSRKKAAKKTS